MALHEVAEGNAHAALDTALLRFLGATLSRAEDGGYSLEITLGDSSLNGVGTLHAGAISMLLEVAAYLAVITHLEEDEQAVTHASSVCYLAAARAGEHLHASGTLLRRTRRLAFLSAELRGAQTLIATASVTKSILPLRRD